MYGADLKLLFSDPINILTTLLFLGIVIIWSYFKQFSIKDSDDARNFLLTVTIKVSLATCFGVYYFITVRGGGDTNSYWYSAGALKNMMLYDLGKFYEVMTSKPTMEMLYGYFNHQTGYPLRYIYMEEESLFVSKVLIPLRLVTYDNYFAATFIISFIAANASFRLYMMVKQIGIFNEKILMIFVLFLPSVAFWTSGISKDTLVFVSIIYMIYYISLILQSGVSKAKFKHWIYLLVAMYFVYHARPFIFYATFIPLFLMFGMGMINRIKSFALLRVTIKLLLFVSIIGTAGYYFIVTDVERLLSTNDSFNQAMVIRDDFNYNTTVYGDDDSKRYSVGEIDYTVLSFVKVVPASIVAGMYRPFIWEALTPSLIFNGLESVLLMVLTIYFFVDQPRARIDAIAKNDVLIFAFGFILIIAFMAGFTSVIFGVLVRIRAPLLPFLGMLLAIDWQKWLSKRELEENEQ